MTTPNFASGTVWTGDNLPVMRGINSAAALAVVGPRTFGDEIAFRTLPGGVIGPLPDSERTM